MFFEVKRSSLTNSGSAIPFYIEVSISLRGGDENYSEMRYWQIHLSDILFEISSGGSVCDEAEAAICLNPTLRIDD